MFKSIIRLLVTILITIAFAFLMITYVGERTKVSGHSMEPQLHDQDQVLLDKLTYCFRNPKRYEIIVFPGPEGGDLVNRNTFVLDPSAASYWHF